MKENYQFLKFIPLNDEKSIGVVEILFYQKIVLRFKLIKTKTGGLFPAPPSIKVIVDGEEKYLHGFAIDSQYENSELQSFIMENLKRHTQPLQRTISPSAGQSTYNPHSSPTAPLMQKESQEELPF